MLMPAAVPASRHLLLFNEHERTKREKTYNFPGLDIGRNEWEVRIPNQGNTDEGRSRGEKRVRTLCSERPLYWWKMKPKGALHSLPHSCQWLHWDERPAWAGLSPASPTLPGPPRQAATYKNTSQLVKILPDTLWIPAQFPVHLLKTLYKIRAGKVSCAGDTLQGHPLRITGSSNITYCSETSRICTKKI